MDQEEERRISAKWSSLFSDYDEHVRRIAMRAFKEPSLRRLFPFASHSDLRFSRSGAEPYDFDLPFVLTTPAGTYEARDGDNSPLGVGDLDAVVILVARATEKYFP